MKAPRVQHTLRVLCMLRVLKLQGVQRVLTLQQRWQKTFMQGQMLGATCIWAPRSCQRCRTQLPHQHRQQLVVQRAARNPVI